MKVLCSMMLLCVLTILLLNVSVNNEAVIYSPSFTNRILTIIELFSTVQVIL